MSDLTWDEIIEQIDQLVINAVEADESDLSTIINIHDELMEIVAPLAETEYSFLSKIGQKAAEIAMSIVLQESEDVEYDLGTVIESCSTLQCMVREIINEDDPMAVDIPEGLGLEIEDLEEEIDDIENTDNIEKEEPRPTEDIENSEESFAKNKQDAQDYNNSESKILFSIPEQEINPDHIVAFLSDMNDLFDTAESAILALENSPDNQDKLQDLLSVFHTIKGNAGILQMHDMVKVAHIAETLLEKISALTPEAANLLFGAIDCFKEMDLSLKSYLDNRQFTAITNPNMLVEEFQEYLIELEQASQAAPLKNQQVFSDEVRVKTEKMIDPLNLETITRTQSISKQVEETITIPYSDMHEYSAQKTQDIVENLELQAITKIKTSDLDDLIDTVGELIISYSMVENDENISQVKSIATQKKISSCTKLVKQLQKVALRARMTPIQPIFQRMKRLGRNLAKKLNKEIVIHTFGENTELDRTVVEAIHDPFMHLVRNAVDHGVEDAQTRKKIEKPAVANIFLRAYHSAGNIIVEIEDDGCGIQIPKIQEKALKLGLIKNLRDPNIDWANFIFHTGFSTKENLSEISGRGMGLGIVKQKIQALEGEITIHSQQGKGSKFTITLPLTLAMLDGIITKINNNNYILNSKDIKEFIQLSPNSISSLIDGAEVVVHKDNSIPIIYTEEIIDTSCLSRNFHQKIGVIVNKNKQPYCLVIDEVKQQQQVVIKSLSKSFSQLIGISGTTILSDGSIAYILDLNNITEKYLEMQSVERAMS
ncbi:chemotaxis protein CheA [Candidatus Uabimicrobium sp. HlEnr_7]|uniref:chemotaxis protein CheA n=1 Tax=Candidatus Uabimicrobium helgolandensis TaxID=3095367 RepID=UPI0035563CE0